MAEYTLLEVHLDDASFNVNAPFVGETDATEEEEESEDGSGLPLVPVFALVVLALAGVAAKKALGSDDADIDVE